MGLKAGRSASRICGDMRFRFDERRATQAAAILLKLAGGRENYTKLLKLLYIADRESLREVGTPIAGATFCNMKNGPLASDVYNCIKGEGPCQHWGEHIETDGYDVRLLKDPGDDELSDFDVDLLTGLHERYRAFDFLGMINEVHRFREWTDPGSGRSKWLRPEEILQAQGIEEKEIQAIEARNRHIAEMDRMLGS